MGIRNIDMVESEVRTTKRYAYKNLIVVSFAFFFIFSATLPIQDLQTSLYSDNLGLMSLFCIYSGTAVGSILFTKVVLDKFGPKITMVISLIGRCIFLSSNVHGTSYILLPCAIIFGLSGGMLWTASSIYIKGISQQYAESTNLSIDDVFSRFYPIFFSIFKLSQISGNIMSSNVLHFHRKKTNGTSEEMSCGPSLCPSMKLPKQNLDVTTLQLITLVLVCLGFLCISFFLLIIFLDRMKESKVETQVTICNSIMSTFHEMKDVRMLLLTPVILLSGVQCGFVYADFPKAYVTCYLGVDMIGWTMSIFGLCSFLSSNIYSIIGKRTGSLSILVAATVIHIALLTWMLKWDRSNTHALYPYLICAGIYGACDTAWRSQLPVILGSVFPTRSNEVFSLYEFWKAIGYAISFAYGEYVCVDVKIYIVIGFLLVGIILCAIVQYLWGMGTKNGWENVDTEED